MSGRGGGGPKCLPSGLTDPIAVSPKQNGDPKQDGESSEGSAQRGVPRGNVRLNEISGNSVQICWSGIRSDVVAYMLGSSVSGSWEKIKKNTV